MTGVLPEGQVYLRSYLAPFAEILGRADVTDIYVNAPEECWAETLGGDIERHRIAGLDGTALTRLARQIAAYAHQGISREHPILSAALPGGERVQIIIPPATRGGIVLAIRKHVSSDLGLEDYVASGAFASAHLGGSRHEPALDAQLRERLQTGDVAGLLGAAVRGRRNILISGGTSTGKTTFLNALITRAPARGTSSPPDRRRPRRELRRATGRSARGPTGWSGRRPRRTGPVGRPHSLRRA